jgi:hypothetical protein
MKLPERNGRTSLAIVGLIGVVYVDDCTNSDYADQECAITDGCGSYDSKHANA